MRPAMQPYRGPPPATAVAPARPEDPLDRFEFACVQLGVLIAPYLTLRVSWAFLTVSDMLLVLAVFLRISRGRATMPFAEWTWLWVAGAVLLAGGLLLGSAVNGDLERGLIVSGQYIFTLILVPFALLGRPLNQCLRLMKMGVLSMVLMCAITIPTYLSGYRSDGTELRLVTGNGRLGGFLENANGMATMIVLTMPLVWFLMPTRGLGKPAGLLSVALLASALLLTASNTGLLGFALAILVFFVGRRSIKVLVPVAVLGAAVLLVGQQYLPETFQHRVLAAVTSGDLDAAGTFSDRQALASEAAEMSEDHILIGLGADRYRAVSDLNQVVHNAYLLLLNEGGALSLFGLLTLLVVPILTTLTTRVRPFGSLVALTTFTVVFVFANLLNGLPHVYGRCWWMPLLLAIGPAVSIIVPRCSLSHPLGRRSAATNLRSASI